MPEESLGESTSALPPNGRVPPDAKDGVSATIFGRRVIWASRPDLIPDHVLARMLVGAHHAPSVGFMQPWGFLLVCDTETRGRIKDLSDRERRAVACFFDEPRRSKYLPMKLEGILGAPLNLCVTCDPTRGGPQVLGRNSIPETDVYSTCRASRTSGSPPVPRA